jgi:predicted dehydrogenase
VTRSEQQVSFLEEKDVGKIKAGMIGLDTSHCEAFVNILHDSANPHHVEGIEVVAAYPGGSEQCAVSRDRVDKYSRAMREEHGISLCDSIEELADKADAFFLESVDGRQHLEQFEILAPHGRPVFIDKPLTCSHEEACRLAGGHLSSGRAASLRPAGPRRSDAGSGPRAQPV